MKSYNYNSGTYIGRGGNEIFFQNWTVPSPKANLVISHGLGEHSGRYSHLIEKLEGKKISIYALDHRGHGKSAGERGHVNSFSDYNHDLKILIDLINNNNSIEKNRKPIILLGHSMGAMIALNYAIHYPEDINGIILSSIGMFPVIHPNNFQLKIIKFLSKYLPKLSLSTRIPADYITRDPVQVEKYAGDPLIYGRITVKWYTEFDNTVSKCISNLEKIKVPTLLLHGSSDKLADIEGSKIVYDGISSKNRELKIFEGLYHETMNELEKDRKKVLAVIEKWINDFLKPNKKKALKTVKKKIKSSRK